MDYDTKLGEWFKEVEKRAQQLRARKTAQQEINQEESVAEPEITRTPLRRDLPPPIVQDPEPQEQTAQTAPTFTAVDIAQPEIKPSDVARSLFEDADVPQVDDFLSFLQRSEERRQETPKVEEREQFSNQGVLGVTEGTGEPRPIASTADRQEEPPVMKAEAAAPPASAEPQPPPAIEPQQSAEVDEAVEWSRFPEQLRHLLDSAQEEVAQHSYKSFKESRASLIQRLLDPPLTLEEAARILNVCPTTVRRYTNRGILKHFRTAGNQRRFRLSDVLSFLEMQMSKNGSVRPQRPSPKD